MFGNPIIRLVVGIPVAAAIVFGLFLAMNAFITVDQVEFGERSNITLDAITPQREQTEMRTNQRSKPKKLDSAKKPPPPPKLSAAKSDIDLPSPDIQGAAPEEIKFERAQNFGFDAVAINDRDAQPIRPPVVSYPRRALERGTEGTCEVRFDVDTRGKPYNIQADCTSSVFKRSAEQAVAKVEFAPKIVKGKPAERRNVVYPLVFELAD
jgi:periplasmic protein TonB